MIRRGCHPAGRITLRPRPRPERRADMSRGERDDGDVSRGAGDDDDLSRGAEVEPMCHAERVTRPTRRNPERGMGTMLIMGVVVALLMLSGAVGVGGRYLLVRQRAHAAADLAALAGAQSYGSGKDGCAQAKTYAGKNDHKLADCKIAGDAGDFVVTVQVAAPAPVRIPVLPRKITVSAHAGPVR